MKDLALLLITGLAILLYLFFEGVDLIKQNN